MLTAAHNNHLKMNPKAEARYPACSIPTSHRVVRGAAATKANRWLTDFGRSKRIQAIETSSQHSAGPLRPRAQPIKAADCFRILAERNRVIHGEPGQVARDWVIARDPKKNRFVDAGD